MIPPYAYPLVEPRPLHPNATPSERLEYQRQMEEYRRAVRERNERMNWDGAAHLVLAGVFVLLSVVAVLGGAYAVAGFRGVSIAIACSLVFWLAVVEVKRRLD